jgi:deoxyribose-phosphate aldolase
MKDIKNKKKFMSIAKHIDHTILKSTTTLADIEKVCEEADQYGFAAVCVPPYYVKDAAQILGNSKVKVATVIGFPFGYSHYTAKLAEAKQALDEGAHELDMVMNLAAFKSNDMAYLETEIGELVKLKRNGTIIKIIIESGILSDEEIVKCCELYKHYAIDFMKTSTGYAEKGASIEAVKIMREHLPKHIQIKASGGIRDFNFAQQLVDAGATRLGCSASVAIVKGEPAEGNSNY